jgi:hypothetical protein
MKMKTSTTYNRQSVKFDRVLDSIFIRKATGECYGDVIGHVEVNAEIGFMTIKLHEHGKAKAEMTLYKPYKDRPKRVDQFLTANGYVLV